MRIINIQTKKVFDIEISKNGENQLLCPECSDSRKKKTDKCLSWNATKNTGYCHHCNGSFVEFKPREEKKQFVRPVKVVNVNLTPRAITYFEGRKISKQTLADMKIYSASEWMPQFNKEVECICFPYFFENELINIKFRGQSKSFKLSKDAELIFYNLDCVNQFEEIIIVEGEIDALSFYEAGLKNVISVPNGANKTLSYLDEYVELFEGKKLIIAVDNDMKGFELRSELIRRFGAEYCSVIDFKECKDANEVLVKHDSFVLREYYQNRKDVPVSGIVDLDNCYDSIYNLFVNGLQKGIELKDSLDNVVTWEAGRLAIWTGIPSHGKSEALDHVNIKLNIAAGWKGVYFSPENFPVEIHFSKIFSKISGKTFDAKYVNQFEFQKTYEYIKNNFFFIMPEDTFSVEIILEKAKYLIKKHGIKFLVIDPYNKLEHNRGGLSETDYISKLLDKLINFARINNVLIHLVAHPTKMKKNEKTMAYEVPTLYDISGSANFYNKADYGITVYRKWGERETTDIIVQKVKFKHWGDGGIVEKQYNKVNGRYEDIHVPFESFSYNNLLNIKETPVKKDTMNPNTGLDNFFGNTTEEAPF